MNYPDKCLDFYISMYLFKNVFAYANSALMNFGCHPE